MDTLVEDSASQDSEIALVCLGVEGGETLHFRCWFLVHFPEGGSAQRDLRPPSFLSGWPVRSWLRGHSLPGSLFLSVESLDSSRNESQPQLSSCQTGFFKNISVFTQHELIGLQCPCGLIAGGRGCALGTLPTLSSSVSTIPGSSGCGATCPFRLLGCPGGTVYQSTRASRLCHRDLAAHKK